MSLCLGPYGLEGGKIDEMADLSLDVEAIMVVLVDTCHSPWQKFASLSLSYSFS